MLKHRKIGDANASRLSHLLTELTRKVSNSLGDSGERATEVPGLTLYRRTAPTLYFCSWGPGCERFRDIVDEVTLEDDLGDRHFVGADESASMTTWHAKHELDEGLDFFARFTRPSGSFEPDSHYWVAVCVGNAEWAASIRRILGSTTLV